MSDRLDAVLANIDTALAECICGNPIPADGPSLDYCSDVCQYRYTAQQAGAEPDAELVYPVPPGETDGRVINAEVNEWIEHSAEHTPEIYYYDETHRYPPGTLGGDLERLQASVDRTASQITQAITLRLVADTTRAAREFEAAFTQVSEACTAPAAEFRRLYLNGWVTATPREPEPSTPEEFRRRALEARHNRNTGPQRRDNRRWRNQ